MVGCQGSQVGVGKGWGGETATNKGKAGGQGQLRHTRRKGAGLHTLGAGRL